MCVEARFTTRSVGRIADDVDGILETAVRNKIGNYTSVPTLYGSRAVRLIRRIEHGGASATADRDMDIC